MVNKNIRLIVIASVVTFIFVFIATLVPLLLYTKSCRSSDNALEITDTKATVTYSEYTGYTLKITGTATNVSGKYISYAQIEYSVYDSNGYNLGSAYDTISNLASGDKWKFEATLYFASSRPSNYKLVDITVLYNY